MFYRKFSFLILCVIFVITGCARRSYVAYHDVERTNYVTIKLTSGQVIEGTVFKAEPHQLVVLRKNRTKRNVLKTSIREIKRKTPVYDDFGRGISEEEIQSVQDNHNAVIYGIGGGALSLGTSFFIGSLVGHNMEEGGTVMAAAMAVGGGLGTLFFINAGKAKDRQEAITKIQEKRRLSEYRKKQVKTEKKSSEDIKRLIKQEKEKQEKLREEREEMLRKLQETDKNQ